MADRILVVKGRVDHKQPGETKLVAMEVSAFEAVLERTEVRFRIDAREAPAGVIRELARLVRDFPGESPVYLVARHLRGAEDVALGPDYRVRPDADFLAEARSLLGGASVALTLARQAGTRSRGFLRLDPRLRRRPLKASVAPPNLARPAGRAALQRGFEARSHRAALLEQGDRTMEVDLGGGGEHRGRLEVVTGALERGESPLLDPVDLELQLCDVCRCHLPLPLETTMPRPVFGTRR